MIKTIKVMLKPNNKQLTRLFQYANTSKFAYNWALGRELENFKESGEFISELDLRKEFTQLKKKEEFSWLKNVSNDVMKQSIKDCCQAYYNFFKKQKRKGYVKFSKDKIQKFKKLGTTLSVYEMNGHPKFKKRKKSKLSFYQDGFKLKVTDTHIKIEGIAMSKKVNRQQLNWIRLSERKRIPTNSKYFNPRITYDGLNWYISVGIEKENNYIIPKNEGIGIDLGIKDFAICSNGQV